MRGVSSRSWLGLLSGEAGGRTQAQLQ
jgi:hypothetical protein